ncbi:MAG: hypothetical protein ACREPT_05460, partial [Rudaea sp.]
MPAAEQGEQRGGDEAECGEARPPRARQKGEYQHDAADQRDEQRQLARRGRQKHTAELHDRAQFLAELDQVDQIQALGQRFGHR